MAVPASVESFPTVNSEGEVRFASRATLIAALPRLRIGTLTAVGAGPPPGEMRTFRLFVDDAGVELAAQGKTITASGGRVLVRFPSISAEDLRTLEAAATDQVASPFELTQASPRVAITVEAAHPVVEAVPAATPPVVEKTAAQAPVEAALAPTPPVAQPPVETAQTPTEPVAEALVETAQPSPPVTESLAPSPAVEAAPAASPPVESALAAPAEQPAAEPTPPVVEATPAAMAPTEESPAELPGAPVETAAMVAGALSEPPVHVVKAPAAAPGEAPPPSEAADAPAVAFAPVEPPAAEPAAPAPSTFMAPASDDTDTVADIPIERPAPAETAPVEPTVDRTPAAPIPIVEKVREPPPAILPPALLSTPIEEVRSDRTPARTEIVDAAAAEPVVMDLPLEAILIPEAPRVVSAPSVSGPIIEEVTRQRAPEPGRTRTITATLLSGPIEEITCETRIATPVAVPDPLPAPSTEIGAPPSPPAPDVLPNDLPSSTPAESTPLPAGEETLTAPEDDSDVVVHPSRVIEFLAPASLPGMVEKIVKDAGLMAKWVGAEAPPWQSQLFALSLAGLHARVDVWAELVPLAPPQVAVVFKDPAALQLALDGMVMAQRLTPAGSENATPRLAADGARGLIVNVDGTLVFDSLGSFLARIPILNSLSSLSGEWGGLRPSTQQPLNYSFVVPDLSVSITLRGRVVSQEGRTVHVVFDEPKAVRERVHEVIALLTPPSAEPEPPIAEPQPEPAPDEPAHFQTPVPVVETGTPPTTPMPVFESTPAAQPVPVPVSPVVMPYPTVPPAPPGWPPGVPWPMYQQAPLQYAAAVPAGYAPPTPQPPAQRPRVDIARIPIRVLSLQELLELDVYAPAELESGAITIFQLFLGVQLRHLSGTLAVEATKRWSGGVEGGNPVLTDGDMVLLAELAMAKGAAASISAESIPRVVGTSRMDARGVCSSIMREMLRNATTEFLESTYGTVESGYLHRTDRTTWRYIPPLNAKEQRFLNLIIDGTRRVVDIPQISGLPHRQGTFRLVALLKAFGLVKFEASPSGQQKDSAPSLEEELAAMRALDAFGRLGAHWSEHPKQLEQRHRDLLKKYGPASPAARRSPAVAADIIRLVETAWGTLSTAEGRRAVRSKLGEQDFAASADILIKHAEMAQVRAELDEMLRCAEIAVELYPTAEAKKTLAKAQELMRLVREKSSH